MNRVSMYSVPNLQSFKLNCMTDAALIQKLADCAEEQIGNFETMFPWQNAHCETSDYVYIFTSMNTLKCPTMLGWLKYSTVTEGPLNIVYIHTISTAHLQYKDIGRYMMETLAFDMHRTHHLIELSPLSKVIEFYELLGFRPLYEGGPYYKWISEERENAEWVRAYSENVRKEEVED